VPKKIKMSKIVILVDRLVRTRNAYNNTLTFFSIFICYYILFWRTNLNFRYRLWHRKSFLITVCFMLCVFYFHLHTAFAVFNSGLEKRRFKKFSGFKVSFKRFYIRRPDTKLRPRYSRRISHTWYTHSPSTSFI